VPASLASSEGRLDRFVDVIQKRPNPPLLAAPTCPTVQATPFVAPKRSSSGLANTELARIPVARCGKVLLMRRLDMEAGELDRVFKGGWSGGYADKVLDAFHAEGQCQ
jgi:hypothetical protein